MKRATPILIPILLIGYLIMPLASVARADCGAEIQAVRAQTVVIKDGRRRQELQKLVEKAEKDDKAGRTALCDQAVQRARILLK
ncbi:MAG: hypothetical protein ACREDI_03990 [Roseiarcus sp.]